MGYILIGPPTLFILLMIGLKVYKRLSRDRSIEARRLASAEVLKNYKPFHVHWAEEKAKTAKKTAAAGKVNTRPRSDKKSEIRGRKSLNDACLSLLDSAAIEHPSGHTKLVARYVLRSKDDDRIELMFEKSGVGLARLWLSRADAVELHDAEITLREYPASDLYRPKEDGGTPSYGRSNTLKKMRNLANADLTRFTIDQVEQLRLILTKLAGP